MEDIFQDGERVVMEHDTSISQETAERERKKETKKDKCSSARVVYSTSDLLALAIYSPKLEGGKCGFCPLPFFPRLLCPGLFDMWSIPVKASLIDRPK